MSANLIRRLAVALVGIPAAVLLVYAGGWWLVAALAGLGGVGAWEFYRLATAGGVRPLSGWGVTAAAALPPVAWGSLQGHIRPATGIGLAVLWLFAALVVALRVRSPARKPLASVSVSAFGALYAGGLPCFALLIRRGDPAWDALTATVVVMLPFVLTWAGDALAMGAGALFGGRRLAPVVSPNKTWAGASAGLLSAIVLAPAYGWLVLSPRGVALGTIELVVFGAVVSIAGQVGDVVESLFKREAGVKDSGGFFPGHGGVLDRLDALYWVLPVSAVLFRLYGLL